MCLSSNIINFNTEAFRHQPFVTDYIKRIYINHNGILLHRLVSQRIKKQWMGLWNDISTSLPQCQPQKKGKIKGVIFLFLK